MAHHRKPTAHAALQFVPSLQHKDYLECAITGPDGERTIFGLLAGGGAQQPEVLEAFIVAMKVAARVYCGIVFGAATSFHDMPSPEDN